MLPNGHRVGLGFRELGTALAALSLLAFAVPALAGQQGGNLQPVGTLLLELDASTSQFRRDDRDGDPTNDRVQAIFDQKILKPKDACLVGLDPEFDPTNPDPNALVSLPGSPNFTDWGIDGGKFALGGRTKKGTGCGQLEFGEIGRLEVNSLVLTDARVQVEAKQDAAARVTLIFDDGVGETVVGTRYLLSGRAVDNPPVEVVAACAPVPVTDCALVREILKRTDGGPDSKEEDDGFWEFSAPVHNVEEYEILRNADGTQGKLSIKGGGEFPDPQNNRSTWIAFDGLVDCGAGSSQDGVTFIRTNEGGCTERVPFDLEFDGEEVTFSILDTANEGTAFAFQVQFAAEAAVSPIPRTVLAYDPAGVDCTGVDPDGQGPFTESCIGLTVCEGTPIRRCADGSGCQEDADCTDGSACQLIDLLAPAGGFPDLVGVCDDGTTPCQEDADCTSPDKCNLGATVEYGCVCEEDVLYLGPGVCGSGNLAGASCQADSDCGGEVGSCELFGRRCDDESGTLAGTSCQADSDCGDGACTLDVCDDLSGTAAGTSCDSDLDCGVGTCALGEDRIAVEQCLFAIGDLRMSRRGR